MKRFELDCRWKKTLFYVLHIRWLTTYTPVLLLYWCKQTITAPITINSLEMVTVWCWQSVLFGSRETLLFIFKLQIVTFCKANVLLQTYITLRKQTSYMMQDNEHTPRSSIHTQFIGRWSLLFTEMFSFQKKRDGFKNLALKAKNYSI